MREDRSSFAHLFALTSNASFTGMQQIKHGTVHATVRGLLLTARFIQVPQKNPWNLSRGQNKTHPSRPAAKIVTRKLSLEADAENFL